MGNLLVINDYGVCGGGTEQRIRLLLQEFLRIKAFDSIHLLEHESSGSKMKGIRIHKCCSKNAAEKTRQIIEENGIGFVQAHNLLNVSTKPISVAKRLGKKVAWFAHDYWVFCGKRILLANAENAAGAVSCTKAAFLKCVPCIGFKTILKLNAIKSEINKADIAIAPSEFVRRLYESHGIMAGKWKIVKPWIDVEEFFRAKPKLKSKNILFVGPLMDYKGAFVAVKAMCFVLHSIPKAKLVFVGNQQEQNSRHRQKIEALAKELNVEKSIVFLGKKSQRKLAEEFESCSAYVCPPVWPELFGLNWAEAMCAGLPVIASDVGSIPELSAGNAVIANAGNAAALGNAIVKVLSNKKLAKKMSAAGKKFACSSFNVTRAAKELKKSYYSISCRLLPANSLA